MKTFKNKDFTKFVRFGPLKPVKQLGFGGNTYHSPPAPKGFYAFPKTLQEPFLIGCLYKTQPNTFGKDNGRYGLIYKSIRREFTFSRGSLWHHLVDFVPPNEVESYHGSWIKTSFLAWVKAINKSLANDVNRFGPEQCSMSSFSKDGYEVFFDSKV